MTPLKHNKDLEPLLPKIPTESLGTELNLMNPIEKWLSEFPMEYLPENEIEISTRSAETRGEYGRGIYRRLRVRVSLSEWTAWIPQPNPNAHLQAFEVTQKPIKVPTSMCPDLANKHYGENYGQDWIYETLPKL